MNSWFSAWNVWRRCTRPLKIIEDLINEIIGGTNGCLTLLNPSAKYRYSIHTFGYLLGKSTRHHITLDLESEQSIILDFHWNQRRRAKFRDSIFFSPQFTGVISLDVVYNIYIEFCYFIKYLLFTTQWGLEILWNLLIGVYSFMCFYK